MIEINENKERIAIVVVGYNRLHSLKRVLSSLLHAKYMLEEVPLVISIDCSGDKELYCYVEEFNWPYGSKYVNINSERMGLKNHIFQCGDLTHFFKGIILLEDDLFVSPYFYSYAEQALDKYGNHEKVAQISLYKKSPKILA